MGNKVSFIIQLQDRFSRVASKVKRALGSLDTKFKKLTDRLAKLRRKVGEVSTSLAKMGAATTAAVTIPIVLMGKAMIGAASDATETASKFNQVFDDVQGKANQVAKEFSKSFGVASSTSKKLIGDTGDLLVGFGFTGTAALNLSREVNGLAADLASFQNLEGGTTRASEALTKALLGETESAKSLGIVIRQNDPAFKAQVKALQQSRGLTEMQAKAITILRVATSQSKKAIGDVSRTWNDYANVVRRSEERTKQLKESFGTLLLPIATTMTIAITELVQKINGLSKPMKEFILIMTGLVAVVGPILLLLAGMSFAFSAISVPVILLVTAIGALVGAFIFLKSNWVAVSDAIGGTIEQIGINFGIVWQGIKDGFQSAIDFVSGKIDAILAPLIKAKELLTSIGGDIFNGGVSTIKALLAPTTPVRSQTDVNVNLRAPEGVIESIKSKTTGKRAGLNMGVNMEAAL